MSVSTETRIQVCSFSPLLLSVAQECGTEVLWVHYRLTGYVVYSELRLPKIYFVLVSDILVTGTVQCTLSIQR